MPNKLADTWKRLLQFDARPWVAFENGTCVLLSNPEPNIEAQAQAILTEAGPFQEGTPSAQFNIMNLQEMPGWVVTGHNPDVLMYVSYSDAGGPSATKQEVGLIGLDRRAKDAESLKIVCVEDRR